MASRSAVPRDQATRSSLDPDVACSMIASKGLRAFALFLKRTDRRRLRDVLAPAEVGRHAAWKWSAWYQRKVLRSQLDTHSDDGSRRHAFLHQYCQPILAHGMPLILQPGCGSGRWLPYLRQISRARYVGFDFSPLLIRYARRTVQGSDAVFLHADMRSFPRLEPVDLILLDYEFLNAFNPNESQDGLRWAHATLKTGDIVIGDVRPRIATATTGSRQWTVAGKATDARLLWSERGVIGRRFFGSQRLSIDLRAMRIVQQQQQDLIWLLGERQRNALFSAQPWREVLLDDLGHIPH